MPLRILIVDDNRDSADSLALLFELWGHEVFVAYDGASGMEIACQQRPDCLILDIQMPKIDGYSLARMVREEGLVGSKIVALSAFSDAAHLRRVEEAGFDYRFTKPASPEELERTLVMIENLLRTAKKMEELGQQNVKLASQTKGLIEEMKTELEEVKEEVQELRQEIQEVKEKAEQDEPPPSG